MVAHLRYLHYFDICCYLVNIAWVKALFILVNPPSTKVEGFQYHMMNMWKLL